MKSKFSESVFQNENGGAISTSACASDAGATASLNVPSWFALQTRRRCEKRAQSLLSGKGVETYLPLIRQQRRWVGHHRTIFIPLFPGYIFVRLTLDPALRLRVLQTKGVSGFVGIHDNPTPIPSAQIEGLRRLLSSDSECSIRPLLHSGQRVRIRGGVLDGLEGILQDRGGKRLVVSIECIQRAVSVEVEGYDLEVA